MKWLKSLGRKLLPGIIMVVAFTIFLALCCMTQDWMTKNILRGLGLK